MTTGSDNNTAHDAADRIDLFGRKLPKRFYRHVSVVKSPGGFTVELDGRSIKTPGKNLLEVEHAAIARAIASDWEQQVDHIDLETMHTSRLVNTAIDHISPAPEAVIGELADYAQSDLLCYRAMEPESLVEAQNAKWDPVLTWLETTHGARLAMIAGVIHQPQPAEAIANLRQSLNKRSGLMLAAMHNLATLTGSVVLAFAVADGYLGAEQAWHCAHVDEDWQISQWGQDEEAAAARARRWLEMEKTAAILSNL